MASIWIYSFQKIKPKSTFWSWNALALWLFQLPLISYQISLKSIPKTNLSASQHWIAQPMRICLNDLFYGHGRKLMQGHMAFESGIVSQICKQQTNVLPGVETFGLCAVMIPCIDGDCSWPPGWGEWDRSIESNSCLNSFSENTSGTSLFSRPRWVEVYNRGGCTLKHCWEKISDPSMERLRMDDERSLVSVWVFLLIFCPPTMILGLSNHQWE